MRRCSARGTRDRTWVASGARRRRRWTPPNTSHTKTQGFAVSSFWLRSRMWRDTWRARAWLVEAPGVVLRRSSSEWRWSKMRWRGGRRGRSRVTWGALLWWKGHEPLLVLQGIEHMNMMMMMLGGRRVQWISFGFLISVCEKLRLLGFNDILSESGFCCV